MTIDCVKCDRLYSNAKPYEDLRWRKRPDATCFEITCSLVDGQLGDYHLTPVCDVHRGGDGSDMSLEEGTAEWIVQEVMGS